MLSRLGQFACVIAFFAICGGHWAVLQTVAWATMIRDYSADSGIVLAIQQTFSGERSCDMCVSITEGRKKESQTPVAISLAKKFEILFAARFVILRAPDAKPFAYPPPRDLRFSLLTFAPPTPVPRSATV